MSENSDFSSEDESLDNSSEYEGSDNSGENESLETSSKQGSSTMHQCEFCKKLFAYHYLLEIHRRKHTVSYFIVEL